MKKVRIRFELSESQYRAIEREARLAGLKIGEMVNILLGLCADQLHARKKR